MTSALTPRGSTRRWRRIRAYILRRDNYICWLCGEPGADSVDHLIPRQLGGDDTLDLLRAAHTKCNAARGITMMPTRPVPSREW